MSMSPPLRRELASMSPLRVAAVSRKAVPGRRRVSHPSIFCHPFCHNLYYCICSCPLRCYLAIFYWAPTLLLFSVGLPACIVLVVSLIPSFLNTWQFLCSRFLSEVGCQWFNVRFPFIIDVVLLCLASIPSQNSQSVVCSGWVSFFLRII